MQPIGIGFFSMHSHRIGWRLRVVGGERPRDVRMTISLPLARVRRHLSVCAGHRHRPSFNIDRAGSLRRDRNNALPSLETVDGAHAHQLSSSFQAQQSFDEADLGAIGTTMLTVGKCPGENCCAKGTWNRIQVEGRAFASRTVTG